MKKANIKSECSDSIHNGDKINTKVTDQNSKSTSESPTQSDPTLEDRDQKLEKIEQFSTNIRHFVKSLPVIPSKASIGKNLNSGEFSKLCSKYRPHLQYHSENF